MNLSGKQLIPASRSLVWEGLNDPELLRQSIPGCQSMEKQADDCFAATVSIKVGPIGARLNGVVTITDLNPMNAYSLICEGDGGAVGFVKSVIKVQLDDEGDETSLSYQVEAQIGGRLAQLGGAVVEATAKQLAALFFKKFSQVLVASTEPAEVAKPDHVTNTTGKPAPDVTETKATLPTAVGFPIGWVMAVLAAVLIGFIAGSSGAGVEQYGWIGLSVGLLVTLVGGVAYGLGRRAATHVIVMDQSLLEKLSALPEGEAP